MLTNILSLVASLLIIAAKSSGESLVSLERGLAMLIASLSARRILCLISNRMLAPARILFSSAWYSRLLLISATAGELPIAMLSYWYLSSGMSMFIPAVYVAGFQSA